MPAQTASAHPLLEVLRGRNPDLAEHARRVIREAHRVLEYTLSTFPGGTDHTLRHTLTVEGIGRQLLSDAFLAALTAEELFFLVTACHYHDLAMAGTEADDASTESREQVRRDHAIRVGDKVKDKWAELGFKDERTANILGEVCRGHRPKKNSEGEASWDELNAIAVLGPGTHVRVRLVSALVYAIDELHLGADRAPVRVQNWRESRDDESRRHWRRHQAINGPSLLSTGVLLFQVDAETPDFEENLRTQVFRKALGALRDLRRQAVIEGVEVPLPEVHVQWNRGKLWHLFLPIVCSDLDARSREEIGPVLLDMLAREGARTDLGALCKEDGCSEREMQAGANRCIDDAITYQHLVQAGGVGTGVVLSAGESVADMIFERMREADELDRLYLGRYCRSWEERLFDSAYGRSYVSKCVLPAIDRSYSVRLAQRPSNDPLRILFERCPTAARLVREFRPAPSNLVKEVLLRQAALTGALFDLHSDPNRILDSELRRAVHAMFDNDPAVAPTIRLIEEQALVGGFTSEQVFAAHDLTDAARDVLNREMPAPGAGIHVTVHQSVPSSAPAATSQLQSLILASQRAETPIALAAAPGHKLEIKLTSDDTVPLPDEQPVAFGIGPAEPVRRGPGYLPARIELSRTNRTVRFYLARFDGVGAAPYPVVVSLPAPPPPGQKATVNLGVIVQWPNLTVRDLRTLETAGQYFRAGGATVELILEGTGELLANITTHGPAELLRMESWNTESIRGLRGLDGELPAPLIVSSQDIRQCGRMIASERNSWWHKLRMRVRRQRVEKWSAYLRLANSDGNTVEEMFLKFFPRNLFNAPQIGPGGTFTQEDLTRQWNSGDVDFRMTAFFEPDMFEMGRLLREWCGDPRQEFPFKFHFGQDPSPSALTRTVLSVIFPRAIDRVWYRERQMIFEFRPVNRREAYELEARYWRSCNQEARSLLAEEILGRLGGPTEHHMAERPQCPPDADSR